MFNTTKIIINAFVSQVREGYQRTYGGLNTNYQAIIAGAGNIVLENIANSDVLYYNVEHSVLVTLVGHNVFVIEHEKSQSGLQYLAAQCNS